MLEVDTLSGWEVLPNIGKYRDEHEQQKTQVWPGEMAPHHLPHGPARPWTRLPRLHYQLVPFTVT